MQQTPGLARRAYRVVVEAFDRAAMSVGLFEELDVTGKTLEVTPAERRL